MFSLPSERPQYRQNLLHIGSSQPEHISPHDVQPRDSEDYVTASKTCDGKHIPPYTLPKKTFPYGPITWWRRRYVEHGSPEAVHRFAHLLRRELMQSEVDAIVEARFEYASNFLTRTPRFILGGGLLALLFPAPVSFVGPHPNA